MTYKKQGVTKFVVRENLLNTCGTVLQLSAVFWNVSYKLPRNHSGFLKRHWSRNVPTKQSQHDLMMIWLQCKDTNELQNLMHYEITLKIVVTLDSFGGDYWEAGNIWKISSVRYLTEVLSRQNIQAEISAKQWAWLFWLEKSSYSEAYSDLRRNVRMLCKDICDLPMLNRAHTEHYVGHRVDNDEKKRYFLTLNTTVWMCSRDEKLSLNFLTKH